MIYVTIVKVKVLIVIITKIEVKRVKVSIYYGLNKYKNRKVIIKDKLF